MTDVATGLAAARVWAARSGAPIANLLKHDRPVTGAALSADGACLVTIGDDGTARIWEAVSGAIIAGPLVHAGPITSAAFGPDGARVVTASSDGTARVWDTVSGAPLGCPLGHDGPVIRAVFNPDGTRVVTASSDGSAGIWDAVSGTPIVTPLRHDDQVIHAAFSADGARVVTTSDDGTARVWDVGSGTPVIDPLQHDDIVTSAAFSPDGAHVLTASVDGTARVWSVASGVPVTRPLRHHGAVTSAVFSPDGAWILTASRDGTARVWNAASGAPRSGPLQHDGPIAVAAFSPDGARVVTASWDATARIWNAASGALLVAPLVHDRPVASAAFSADGARIITLLSAATASPRPSRSPAANPYVATAATRGSNRHDDATPSAMPGAEVVPTIVLPPPSIAPASATTDRSDHPIAVHPVDSAVMTPTGSNQSSATREPRPDESAATPSLEESFLRFPFLRLSEVFNKRFRLESVISKSSRSVVFRGMEISTNRALAIKVTDGTLHRARLYQQSRVRKTHKHTIATYEVGLISDSTLYIVMELLDGKTLRQLIDEGAFANDLLRTRLQRTFEILIAMCSALAEMHGCGLVHRNLKPEKVFLARCADGHELVKILDVDLAGYEGIPMSATTLVNTSTRFTGIDASGHSRGDRATASSRPDYRSYMSPEQNGGKPLDGRSDIYSLGVLAYEMIAGWLPRDVNNHFSSMNRCKLGLPDAVECIMQKCLETDRHRRYPDVTQLADALQQVIARL